MLTDKTITRPVDFRATAYRLARQMVIIVGAGMLIKLFLLDTVLIKTDEMAPTLLPGDRVIMLRLPYAPLFKMVTGPRRGNITVFNPLRNGGSRCLRIAALDGDSIGVWNAAFNIPSLARFTPQQRVPDGLVLPADYSPRDQMAPLRLPRPGTRFTLDSLSLRDFMFCASMAAQEHPGRKYAVAAGLFIDALPARNIAITAFPLYKGDFDSIPDSLKTDWFFWDRLLQYLSVTNDDKRVNIRFRLMENNAVVPSYTVKRRFVFLLADNWIKGLDSRYFGPVRADAGRGVVVGVLWSRGMGDSGKISLRWNRIMRIVR